MADDVSKTNVADLLEMMSRLGQAYIASGEQTASLASFSRSTDTNAYVGNDCRVRYPGGFAGIAAGRVWGEVTCEAARNVAHRPCRVVAQFRLENCAQE